MCASPWSETPGDPRLAARSATRDRRSRLSAERGTARFRMPIIRDRRYAGWLCLTSAAHSSEVGNASSAPAADVDELRSPHARCGSAEK
jgi:hypothetical protein